MIEEQILKKYPQLAQAYLNREGNKTLSKEADAHYARLENIKQIVKTFTEEESRGIMHRPDYHDLMTSYKNQIPLLQANADAAMQKWMESKPKYDSDNQICQCGCVIVNGDRVHWCGEHY